MTRLERALKWEFWPYQIFYIPAYFYVLWLGLRNLKPTFFTAANPGMEYGGFVEYSKGRMYELLPERYVPRTLSLPPIGLLPDQHELQRQLHEAGIDFPLIAKPDHGERGLGVEKLANMRELADYLAVATGTTLLQEFIPGDREYGVLYCRMPDEQTGWISSVVIKEQLSVRGDGKTALADLIDGNRRATAHRAAIRHALRASLTSVPAAEESITLSEIGNHSRGATFRSGMHLVGKGTRARQLARVFDELSNQVPGFYIGRYDVKAADEEALLAGRFKVLELNGVNSEPAHIYDPDNSLLRAYRDLFRHWKTIYRISRANIRRGAPVTSLRELVSAIREHFKDAARLREGLSASMGQSE